MTNSTRWPAARSRATASTEPGIGWCASQTTPSRSHSTTHGPSVWSTSSHWPGVIDHLAMLARRVATCTGASLRTVRRSALLTRRAARRRDVRRRTTCCRSATSRRSCAAIAHNIVAVDVPLERDGTDRYDAAGRRLRQWIAERRARAPIRAPSFTLYRDASSPTRPAPPRARSGSSARWRSSTRAPGRAAPRTHDAEGHDRPPRPHPGHAVQPVAGLGPVARPPA